MSLITTMSLVLALSSADAPAQGKPESVRPGVAHRLCEAVVCTAAQKTQVQSIAKELHEDTKGDREAIRRLERDLATEIAKASPSDDAIEKVAAEIARHQAETTRRALDAVLEVHAVLDATQRGRLAKLVAEHGVRGLLGGPKGGRPGKAGRETASRTAK
jgi:hypothetical protein